MDEAAFDRTAEAAALASLAELEYCAASVNTSAWWGSARSLTRPDEV
jgi:hypothetical protein